MTQAVRQHGPGFLVACLAGGLASGLTGLGGGTVTTPILTAFLGYGQHAAHAASLAAMAGSSAVWCQRLPRFPDKSGQASFQPPSCGSGLPRLLPD